MLVGLLQSYILTVCVCVCVCVCENGCWRGGETRSSPVFNHDSLIALRWLTPCGGQDWILKSSYNLTNLSWKGVLLYTAKLRMVYSEKDTTLSVYIMDVCRRGGVGDKGCPFAKRECQVFIYLHYAWFRAVLELNCASLQWELLLWDFWFRSLFVFYPVSWSRINSINRKCCPVMWGKITLAKMRCVWRGEGGGMQSKGRKENCKIITQW